MIHPAYFIEPSFPHVFKKEYFVNIRLKHQTPQPFNSDQPPGSFF